MAANSNNVYGIIEIYHRSNTHNASIYHHFFSPLVFQKFKYFTNLIKTLPAPYTTVDFEIYNVEKNAKYDAMNKIVQTIRKSCQHFYPSFVGNLSSYLLPDIPSSYLRPRSYTILQVNFRLKVNCRIVKVVLWLGHNNSSCQTSPILFYLIRINMIRLQRLLSIIITVV